MRRRIFAAAALAAGIAIVPTIAPVQAAAPPNTAINAEKDPILFVHGFISDASVWDAMVARFQADGYTKLHTFSYDYTKSNALIAEDVKAQVQKIQAATGSAKVDVITHSMGSLSSRYFIKNLGGEGKVDDWVSLAGANHGTWAASVPECWTVSCKEMIPGSAFLAELNADDETPGKVNYGTFYSATDGIIIPYQSTILSGATNTQTKDIGHNEMLDDADIYAQARDFVRF